jgi:hypothetical protein
MILKFPDLATLRLALTTEAVPLAMAQAPAVAGFDDQDQVWVETAGSLPRGNQNELKRLGAQSVRSSGASLKTEVSCWPEMLPLEKDRGPVERLDTTPVLFDLPSGEALAELVLEVLRLGNERQGFRWLEADGGKAGNGPVRGLLRVVGPPYYSLLRALDRQGREDAPVAYLERAPRIWVELGYNHPLVQHIKAPAGKILLMRPPRQWSVLKDEPFRDIYEVLEIALPDAPAAWRDAPLKAHLSVAPVLRSGGAAEGAELWVLRDDPIKQLNDFVQNADDALLQRLAFAVGEHHGAKTIVVRVRQSKQAPPVLVLKAEAYKHYLKLPNLFLPVGTRLHPPLRRDVVRKLLAEDTNQITWLQPGPDGTFSPQGLPEESFRPLFDWIDYVLDHDRVPLQAWVQAAQFDFEPFICEEEQEGKPKKPPSPERPKGGRSERGGRDYGPADAPTVEFRVVEDEGEEAAPALDDFAAAVKAEPSELQKQARALEERFLALEGGLDAPERQALWPEIARLRAALGDTDDAGACWMSALWERDEPLHAWTWAWFCAEAARVPTREEGAQTIRPWVARVSAPGAKSRELTTDELDRLLNFEGDPGAADLRALAAYIVWAARQSPPPAALVQRLSPVSRFLEKNERLLPVRAVWLAWAHLAQLSQGDVLGLARARDRLLERLYHSGLRPEQDLPSFLRFAGQPTSQRFRAVRQWLTDLGDGAQAWIANVSGKGALYPSAQTAAYVDLIFAFGLARLGESDAARALLNRATAALGKKDDAHQWLLGAFKYRILQALEGKPHTGPLPEGDLELLESMERLLRYVVDRLRKHSHILEPDQRINPYRHWGARISDFERALTELTDVTDRDELARRVEELLAEVPKGPKGTEPRSRVLKAGLEVAPRVGEDFARKLLDQAIPCYDLLPEPKDLPAVMDQASFLEKALFVAGHFGRTEHVHPLVARFQRMLQGQRGPQSLPALDLLATQCFRGLRKLGMRDEIDQLLRQMADLVLEGRDVKAVDFKDKDKDKDPGPAALRALLNVASGWYYFGRDNQAEPVLQVARALLLKGELAPREQTQTAVSYAAAVGQAPVEVAQKRLEEVFKSLKGVQDTYTTSTHFSVSQLDVAEAVVLAVVSDDFTVGTQARRWLDDDEFLVRRRIHRDMRALLAKS